MDLEKEVERDLTSILATLLQSPTSIYDLSFGRVSVYVVVLTVLYQVTNFTSPSPT